MLKREALKKEKESMVSSGGKIMDEEGKATAAMLDEIRMLIKTGPQAPAKDRAIGRKDDSNSFANNPMGQVPASVKAHQQKQARQAKIKAKISAANTAANSVPSTIPGGKKITKDQLLDHLLAQPLGAQHGYVCVCGVMCPVCVCVLCVYVYVCVMCLVCVCVYVLQCLVVSCVGAGLVLEPCTNPVSCFLLCILFCPPFFFFPQFHARSNASESCHRSVPRYYCQCGAALMDGRISAKAARCSSRSTSN